MFLLCTNAYAFFEAYVTLYEYPLVQVYEAQYVRVYQQSNKLRSRVRQK